MWPDWHFPRKEKIIDTEYFYWESVERDHWPSEPLTLSRLWCDPLSQTSDAGVARVTSTRTWKRRSKTLSLGCLMSQLRLDDARKRDSISFRSPSFLFTANEKNVPNVAIKCLLTPKRRCDWFLACHCLYLFSKLKDSHTPKQYAVPNSTSYLLAGRCGDPHFVQRKDAWCDVFHQIVMVGQTERPKLIISDRQWLKLWSGLSHKPITSLKMPVRSVKWKVILKPFWASIYGQFQTQPLYFTW